MEQAQLWQLRIRRKRLIIKVKILITKVKILIIKVKILIIKANILITTVKILIIKVKEWPKVYRTWDGSAFPWLQRPVVVGVKRTFMHTLQEVGSGLSL